MPHRSRTDPAIRAAVAAPALLLALLALLLTALAAAPLAAQRQPLEAGIGPALVVHGDAGGLGLHLLARRRLFSLDSIALPPSPEADGLIVPLLEVHAQALYARAHTDARRVSCDVAGSLGCSERAEPVQLLGLGLVSRWPVTAERRAVQLYLVPLGAGVYLRFVRGTLRPVPEDLCEQRPALCGSSLPWVREPRRSMHAGVGVVSGAGARIRLGRVEARLEVQAHLVRDLDGGEGGSVPIGLAVRF